MLPTFYCSSVALILPHFLYYFCHWLLIFVFTSIITSMARNSLLCADVPLRNYSLTYLLMAAWGGSLTRVKYEWQVLQMYVVWSALLLSKADIICWSMISQSHLYFVTLKTDTDCRYKCLWQLKTGPSSMCFWKIAIAESEHCFTVAD